MTADQQSERYYGLAFTPDEVGSIKRGDDVLIPGRVVEFIPIEEGGLAFPGSNPGDIVCFRGQAHEIKAMRS